jgi:hypothetical protein
MKNDPYEPLTKSQRNALIRAAEVIETKAQELSIGCRCSNTLVWDSLKTGQQYSENIRVANRLRGMASSKTSRL